MLRLLITDWIVGISAQLTCARTHRWAALHAVTMGLSVVSCVFVENTSSQNRIQIRNKLYTYAHMKTFDCSDVLIICTTENCSSSCGIRRQAAVIEISMLQSALQLRPSQKIISNF